MGGRCYHPSAEHISGEIRFLAIFQIERVRKVAMRLMSWTIERPNKL